MREYEIIDGTAYHKDTPDDVIRIIENARKHNQRIRLFYGDRVTGIDWLELYDTIGTIGRSTGQYKVPLLIKNSRSFGGGAILDHCIVKITRDKETIYQAKNYQMPEFAIVSSDLPEYLYNVVRLRDNAKMARFKTENQATNYIEFMQGKRNKG